MTKKDFQVIAQAIRDCRALDSADEREDR